MKNNFLAIFIVLVLFGQSAMSSAATSEVTWQNPEKYRDVKSGMQSKKKYQQRVFKSFDKHFAKLAEQLPQDQILKIVVTNVDLAGDVFAGGIDQIRIVKDIYIPRMAFSYQLLDANNGEIKTGDVKLKDMNFLNGSQMRYRQEHLGYEKKMLDDWFSNTFSPMLAKNE